MEIFVDSMDLGSRKSQSRKKAIDFAHVGSDGYLEDEDLMITK